MQKKIIALAVAAALTAPAAFADTSNVTVYGQINMSYDMMSPGSSAAGVTSQNVRRIGSNTSRLGLKGAEDMGDGLYAIWQIETQIDPGQGTTPAANSANTIGGRNTFGGLKSESLGTVILGRHDTPYKIATRSLDVFGDNIADNRMLVGGVAGKSAAAAFDGRQDQVIAYISPKLGDMFTGAIAYVNLSPTAIGATAAKNSATSLAGMFDITGGFYGSLAYEVHDFGAVTAAAAVPAVPGNAGTAAIAASNASKEKATKLGFGYKQDAFAVNFVYEKTSDDLGVAAANKYGHNAYYLSGKYNVTSTDTVKVAYTKMGNVGGVTSTGAKDFTIGYDHNLSKRTAVYALYSKLNNDSAANYGFSTNGTSGAVGSIGAGAAPSVFSLGMRHAF